MKIKNFFRKWGDGIETLPPRKILQSQMIADIGIIIGTIFATFFLIRNGFWYFFIVMSFMILLQGASFINHYKQYKAFDMEVDKKLLKKLEMI